MAEQQSLFDDVRAPAPPTDERFERFWALYPKARRVDKPRALAAFLRNVTTHRDWMTIQRVLPIQAESARWTESARYIPHPATYLNNRRWEEDLAAYAPVLATTEELHAAHRVRNASRTGCPHDTPCDSWRDCIDRIVAHNRARAGR